MKWDQIRIWRLPRQKTDKEAPLLMSPPLLMQALVRVHFPLSCLETPSRLSVGARATKKNRQRGNSWQRASKWAKTRNDTINDPPLQDSDIINQKLSFLITYVKAKTTMCLIIVNSSLNYCSSSMLGLKRLWMTDLIKRSRSNNFFILWLS